MIASVIGTLSRLGLLQALPGLDELSAPAMAVVAEMARERHYPRRTLIADPRRPAAVAHVVVDGELVLQLPGGRPTRVGPGGHVGWWTVLADDAVDFDLSTWRGALTLAIDREAMLDIAEHSSHGFDVLHGLTRSIAARLVAHGQPGKRAVTVLRPDVLPGPASDPPNAATVDALDTVERILHLRRMPVLRGVNLDVVSQLAGSVQVQRLRRGQALWPAGDDATLRPLYLVCGRVEWTGSDDLGGESIDAPAMIGLPHALAGEPPAGRLRATAEGVALTLDVDAMLDLAEDNADLALGLVTGLASRLREETGAR